MSTMLRRWLVGEPLPTAAAGEQKLPKYLALPVFASDALSSTAYGPEEVLLALAAAGALALGYSVGIVIAISVLIAIVTFSYRQTVYAYPSGGGSYIVAKDNLGVLPGLFAASALLIDYVLTVAVSIAAGVAAILSAYPALLEARVGICLAVLALVVMANLRGVRESGLAFALPTYLFIASFTVMIVVGAVRAFAGLPPVVHPAPLHPEGPLAAVSIFLILRAFASGCSSMTGLETVSNGVPVFRPPESRNAAITMVTIGGTLIFLIMGLTLLARHFGVNPDLTLRETVASRVAEAVAGRSWIYYAVQWTTMLVLVIAANSAFAGFPRLAAVLGGDGFAPRQLRNLGDRLVFANGILLLGILAGVLLVIFRGETTRLIPLYAVGVFLSFTLSQAGMVRRWFRLRTRGWQVAAVVNGIGAITTGLVLVVIVVAKFIHGAWAVVVLIPLLVLAFRKVHAHYDALSRQLTLAGYTPRRVLRHQALVLVGGVHRGVVEALIYARAIDPDCEAVFVEIDPAETPALRTKWAEWGQGVPLTVVPSPWRSLTGPLIQYIATVRQERGLDMVTVVIPEFATTRWWHRLLHNQSGLVLKWRLMFQRNVVVTNVRYWVK